MKILGRYILREYLVPLFYCLTGFISIYVLFELFGSFSRLRRAQLPFWTTVDYFFAYLAPFFEWLAPAAVMLAALYTMWNFCRHSELVAMRANGISFFAISRPIILTAIAMGALVFYINDYYVPHRAQWARQMKTIQFDLQKLDKASNLIYRNQVGGRTWTVGVLESEDAKELGEVKLTIDRPNGGTRLMTIVADKVRYLDGEWWFSGCEIRHFDEMGVEKSNKDFQAADALPLRCFPDFDERPEDFLMLNREWAYNSIGERIRYLETHPELSEETRRKYVYDTWAKVLSPFMCLVIVLFSIPAGIASGRQSVFKGILGALGMFFGFAALVIGCMVLANLSLLAPVIAAFLPYVIFFVLAIRAFRKQR